MTVAELLMRCDARLAPADAADLAYYVLAAVVPRVRAGARVEDLAAMVDVRFGIVAASTLAEARGAWAILGRRPPPAPRAGHFLLHAAGPAGAVLVDVAPEPWAPDPARDAAAARSRAATDRAFGNAIARLRAAGWR
jgi:hypothetical protein